MTPQQSKAKELYDRFYSELYSLTSIRPRVAKQCALVAVDEILKIVNPILAVFETESDGYWESVKDEIIKL